MRRCVKEAFKSYFWPSSYRNYVVSMGNGLGLADCLSPFLSMMVLRPDGLFVAVWLMMVQRPGGLFVAVWLRMIQKPGGLFVVVWLRMVWRPGGFLSPFDWAWYKDLAVCLSSFDRAWYHTSRFVCRRLIEDSPKTWQFVCRRSDEDGPETWRFVCRRSVEDGPETWQFVWSSFSWGWSEDLAVCLLPLILLSTSCLSNNVCCKCIEHHMLEEWKNRIFVSFCKFVGLSRAISQWNKNFDVIYN